MAYNSIRCAEYNDGNASSLRHFSYYAFSLFFFLSFFLYIWLIVTVQLYPRSHMYLVFALGGIYLIVPRFFFAFHFQTVFTGGVTFAIFSPLRPARFF